MPKFAEPFKWAVVRLATYASAREVAPKLLFGSVSLINQERPKPVGQTSVDRHPIQNQKGGSVFFRRTVLSAASAIAWYRSNPRGSFLTPKPAPDEGFDSSADGRPLASTTFQDNPDWPLLGLPVGTEAVFNSGSQIDPAPFVGLTASRIHCRLGENDGFETVTADPAALLFLERRLHIDLATYSEYLGSLALIVPDPVLRRVQHYVLPPEDNSTGERLAYRVIPRPGWELDELKFTALDRRANLLARFDTRDVGQDGIVMIEGGSAFDQTGYVVSHPDRGVLRFQQPLPFIRSVQARIGLAGRKVRVELPKTTAKGTDASYEVYETTEIPVNVGEPPTDRLVRVRLAELRRARQAAAQSQKQTWFDGGQREEALGFIRRQLSGARGSVLIADPYLSGTQIMEFLHAVPRTSVDFTILTSRLAFQGLFANGAAQNDESNASREEEAKAKSLRNANEEAERLKLFEKALETLKQRGMKSVKAHVLEGKAPPLHDRFLVIDEEVLFLGNSLNTLGDRASLILALPDPEPVLEKLRSYLMLAPTFAVFAERRRGSLARRIQKGG